MIRIGGLNFVLELKQIMVEELLKGITEKFEGIVLQ
jgi:hypothetical protein